MSDFFSSKEINFKFYELFKLLLFSFKQLLILLLLLIKHS